MGRKPFSRLREKVPGGRMRGRERSEACFCCCLEGQEQLASLAPSSGAARHLLPLRRRRALSERCGRELTDEALLPLRRRRADPDSCGERWEGSPSPVHGRRCPKGG